LANIDIIERKEDKEPEETKVKEPRLSDQQKLAYDRQKSMVGETPKDMRPEEELELNACIKEQEKFISSSKYLPIVKDINAA